MKDFSESTWRKHALYRTSDALDSVRFCLSALFADPSRTNGDAVAIDRQRRTTCCYEELIGALLDAERELLEREDEEGEED